MKVNNWYFALLLCLCFNINSRAQTDSINRLKPLVIGASVVYTGALIGLNELWYSDFERQSFRFFDDSKEWKQVDKVGHFYAAFQLSASGYHALKWANVSEKKSLLWGTLFSAIVLTPIEVFDGFSAAYGASYSDLLANTAGATFFYMQQKKWGEIRIHPKFSFQQTNFAAQRPELLGNNFQEELLKDYNGQTYWLSFDLSKFSRGNFPKWLNIAIGYGATGMLAARDQQSEFLGYRPRRQYYLALDFDFHEYKSKSKFVNTMLYFVNMIHLPAPTLALDDKLKFHFIYY